jgi:putative ABC transport system ATP-binding protein
MFGSREKETILEVQSLRKLYGSGDGAVKALDGVDMEVYDGELLIILGSSGSGKSTLLNMIGGMDLPTSGSIRFKGREISHFKDKDLTLYRKNNIGFVFQSFNLISELTVRENVALTADTKNNPGIVDHMLDLLGLSAKKDKYPSQLSGGQQQRVAIARALAGNADILLCDEPTGALDYETGKQILIKLQELSRENGKTVVIVTHTKEISLMGDRVITVKDGKIKGTWVNDDPLDAESIEW